MAEEIKVKFTIDTADSAKSVGEVRKAIKDLTSEVLRVGESGQGVDQLNKKIGELTEKLSDAKDVTNAYRGSGVEKLTSSLGLLKEGFSKADPGKLSSGFKVLGSAMKALPIFLIITAIQLLVENFQKLADKFEIIGNAVKFVTGLFNSFTDAIGLTTTKLNEQTTKTLENNKKILDSQTEKYDNEIRLAKAAGKVTTDLEIEKQKAIAETTQASINALDFKQRLTGKQSEDEKKQLEELRKQNRAAYNEINVIQTQAITDANNKKEKSNTDAANKQKSLNEKAKKEHEDNLKQLQTITDNSNLAKKQALAKTEEERVDIEYQQALKSIDNIKGTEKEKAAAKEAINSEFRTKFLEAQKKDEAIEADKETARKEKKKEKAKEDLDIELQNNVDKAQLKLINHENDLVAQKAFLDAQLAQELSNTELTENQKELIRAKYRQLNKDLDKQASDEKLQIFNDYSNAVSNLSSALFEVENAGRDKNSKEYLASAKKQFQINKALQFTQTLVNGASAAVAAIKDSGFLTPLGIANFAAATSITIASLAKIASSQFTGGNGGGGNPSGTNPSGGNPQTTPTNTFTPVGLQKIGGSGGTGFNNPNLSTGGTDKNKEEPIRAYVVSQEITSSQNKSAVLERRSTFGG